MAFQFPPLLEKKKFPILAAQTDEVIGTLSRSDYLAFCAPVDIPSANHAIRNIETEWHFYGDTRWPEENVWVEFPMDCAGCHGTGGVLIMRREIPDEADEFEWCVTNRPLIQVCPAFGADSFVDSAFELLCNREFEEISGPKDSEPRYVQDYCVYHQLLSGEPTGIAAYTDLLNADGVVIPKYRMGDQASDLHILHVALHAIFRLRNAREIGLKFETYGQLLTFTPVQIQPDTIPPRWMRFHPLRALRGRPEVRALPDPKIVNGSPFYSDFERLLETDRRAINAHLLAYERTARVASAGLNLHHTSGRAIEAAFVHRANGGAIYVLPERLVEEFDQTGCEEVRVGDIAFPFPNIYLKFIPPYPIKLGEGAYVDGCYLVRQGKDENGNNGELLAILTSRLDGVDYEKSVSMACVDPTFALHLPVSDRELTFYGAIERGVEAFTQENAPPEEDLSREIEQPDGRIVFMQDTRAASRKERIDRFRSQEPAFRACLNIIVNALCFIEYRPEDVTDTWEGEPPADVVAAAQLPGDSRRNRDKKAGAILKLERGDYTRIKLCGSKLFADSDRVKGDGTGRSPSAHWRRGHWRRQRHGPGLTLIGLRWIRPTIVMKESGPVVEARLYEVAAEPLGQNTD